MFDKLKITGAAVLAAGIWGGVAWAGSLPALYTHAQAAAGAGAYGKNCAMCHGANLEGGVGPALVGKSFADSAKTVGGAFTTVATQMPMGQPGSLSHTEYEDIMAYILNQNGYPAGNTPFSYDQGLKSTTTLVSRTK